MWITYHCDCSSFFSWFSETQQKDDMDEMHDEVRSIDADEC